MNRPAFAVAFATAVVLALSGCSMEVQFRDITSANDFAKSEIIPRGRGIADGVSQLVVLVRLVNSDGKIVKGYKPEYVIVSGTGAISSDCTVSDESGLSTCHLRSTIAGWVKLKLVNLAATRLEREVLFENPQAGGTVVGLVSGASQSGTGAGGWKIEGSIGIAHDTPVATGTGGSKVYGGIQGAISSHP